MNKWVVDETILDGASYELLEDIVAVTGRASKKSFKGRAAWKCKSAAAAAFQSLCLEDRLLVGELLMALALESHSFRSHSSAVVGGLQTLARMGVQYDIADVTSLILAPTVPHSRDPTPPASSSRPPYPAQGSPPTGPH